MVKKYISEIVTSNTYWYQHPLSIFSLDPQRQDSNLSSLFFISFLCYTLYFLFKKYILHHVTRTVLAKYVLILWFLWTVGASLYHLLSVDYTVFFQLISNPSEMNLQDIPAWSSSLIYGIFGCVLRYEIGIRFLLLFPSLNPCVPRLYQGSLDGEFIWATLAYSFSVYELLPFCFLKYVSLTVNSLYVLVHLMYGSLKGPLQRMLMRGSLIIFWCRRIFALWSLFFGSGIPWLLWVPDALVILSALLFDVSNRPAKSMVRETAYSPSSPSSFVTNDMEREWYEKFLLGNYPEEDSNDSLWSPSLSRDSFEDLTHSQESSGQQTVDPLGMEDYEISSSEVDLLLKEAISADSFIDDSYVCPNRVYTRRMRQSLRRRNTLLEKTSTAWNSVSHRIRHFKSALSNPSNAVTQMVDALLESRKRLKGGIQSNLVCIICRDSMRDTILLPCRHLSICQGCKETMEDKNLDSCPICFKEIQGSIKIYWS